MEVTDQPAVPVSRARPKRLRYLVAGGLCAAAVLFLVFGGLSRNIIYFKTVSEAVKERPTEGVHRFRLMGAVVAGSQVPTADGVTFEVTDGVERAKVVHHGDPGDLFKDGTPVVCEGRWDRNGVFASDRLMIKHGAEYKPPPVDASK